MDYGDCVMAELGKGFNCAEAMILTFSKTLGLPSEIARLATPFGGGLSRTGHVCGLVSGAVMVLGWALGRTDAEDSESKEAAYAAARKLVSQVESMAGATTCYGVLGVDLREEEGRTRAERGNLYDERCHSLAPKIAEVVEHLLREAKVLT